MQRPRPFMAANVGRDALQSMALLPVVMNVGVRDRARLERSARTGLERFRAGPVDHGELRITEATARTDRVKPKLLRCVRRPMTLHEVTFHHVDTYTILLKTIKSFGEDLRA
jgi:hypothetical protein